MKFVIDFFNTLGFDFKQDLKSRKLDFNDNLANNQKKGTTVYFYESPSQTKTSFYIVAEGSEELDLIRKYIWNEDKVDLFFIVKENNKTDLFSTDTSINLYYAKGSPNTDIKHYEIDSFSGNRNDTEKLEKIKKWQFDSGAFWLNYANFLEKAKKSKSIDKELIEALKSLKSELYSEIKDEEIVQALIDRTLYIKYLEDNHIINSHFYKHYFKDEKLTYKELLNKHKKKDLNKLFATIHEIFNNNLFDRPKISEDFLTDNVCNLLHASISGTNHANKQLRLFDFHFNVLPVEFISYIYEIFLSDRQKAGGIYYTPKKLAQLIVDDVIPQGKIGRVLDPSCGSGMFLIVAYQRLLENAPTRARSISQQIEYRMKLLAENIFGIEKETIAQRFTIFSLSLQIFRDIDKEKIKKYIAEQLDQYGKVDLFSKFSFFNNIVCGNSLDISRPPFIDETFNYIIGNPPFLEIKATDNEIQFLNHYNVTIDGKEIGARKIVGKHQISQCFLLKVKDWSNRETRFGFVSNNSSFYNDDSKEFQFFFYKQYCIEKIYELSKVKKILFEKAKESVNALVFTNRSTKGNFIEYYPVEMGIFSEKPFELLVIQEDKILKLNQEDLIKNQVRLRDFLIGNEFDKKLLEKLNSNCHLKDFILRNESEKYFIHRGFEIWGQDSRKKEFNIEEREWKKMSQAEQEKFLNIFIKNHFNNKKNSKFNKSYIKPKNLTPFWINESDQFIDKIDNFHRARTEDIYSGEKIILTRLGDKLNAVYSTTISYFDFSVYTIKLANNKLYYLICAMLNSHLSDYFINQHLRKRVYDSFPRIGIDDIKLIPIPKNLNEKIVKEISKISKSLTEGKFLYDETTISYLNELIFDLYDLSFLEKQRIRDYFIAKRKATKQELELYKQSLKDTIDIYVKIPIEIEVHHSQFDLIVAKICMSEKNTLQTSAKKVSHYLVNEVFEQNPTENYLTSQEKIFGKDCIYIIRKDENINWTETKAYEDGQEILKRIK